MDCSTFLLKDYIPIIGSLISLLGTCAAIYIGYAGISVQIHKNRRMRWLEEFRAGIANLYNLLHKTEDVLKKKEIDANVGQKLLDDLRYSIINIALYLDDNNELHQEFFILIMDVTDTTNDAPKFHERMTKIIKLGKEIIDKEIRSIEKVKLRF